FFPSYGDVCAPHSFPTRRSSDLLFGRRPTLKAPLEGAFLSGGFAAADLHKQVGGSPIFYLWRWKTMSRRTDDLKALLAPVIEAMGYEFWGLDYIQGRGAVLRIFIDSENGITVDDCAAVSHQVSGVLDVEDPIPGEYNLEVSSPGMERPLYTLEQFAMYVGDQVQMRLLAPVAGKRRVKGLLD